MKLRRLFSVSTLTTTITVGMTVATSFTVLATTYYQVSAARVGSGTPCGSGQYCGPYNTVWGQFYYCCWAGDSCYSGVTVNNPPNYGTAWCAD